jgi:hypothetical protein
MKCEREPLLHLPIIARRRARLEPPPFYHVSNAGFAEATDLRFSGRSPGENSTRGGFGYEGNVTGIVISAALLIGAAILILWIAMRS